MAEYVMEVRVKITAQEIGMGLMVVVCKCCGNVYKGHGQMNACSFSFTPNYGCDKCRGISKAVEQR